MAFDYAKEYSALHRKGEDTFSGMSLMPHVKEIGKLIEKTSSTKLLDFGCGKAKQYIVHRAHEKWGVPRPTLYDVGVKPFSKLPKGTFHGVICTDVLEHIAEEDLDEVIERLVSYTERFLFISVATRLAKKTFADGSNVHKTVRMDRWWMERIRSHYSSFAGRDPLVSVRFMGEGA
jgi:hypothetical protein